MDPAYAHAIANTVARHLCPASFHVSDDFVSRYHRQSGRRCPSLDFVEFRMAYAAGHHPHQHLVAGRLRHRQIHEYQRLGIVVERGNRRERHRSHSGLREKLANRNYGGILARMTKRRSNLSCLLLSLLLAACAGSSGRLNSDMIERRFGSYGVDVLEQTASRRVSSLYSGSGEQKTTRTYAVVEFVAPDRRAYAVEHAKITAGGSIGATFRSAGWQIDKQHIFIGELEVTPEYRSIADLMRIELPATLATHHYLFTVSRDERSWNYATITEIHHPQFLTADDLRELYGEILFDDSNRDNIRDFIGAPR